MTAGEIVTTEQVTIASAHGACDGALSYGESRPTFAAALLGPHPYMGGSMNNRLVVALAEALAQGGGAALRFDYLAGGADALSRDPTASLAAFWATGAAPVERTMLHSATAAIDWLPQAVPAPVVIVGYSFGAHLATRLAPQAAARILIAPTLTRHDFSLPLDHDHARLLVIYSDNDFATPRSVTARWIDGIEGASACCIPGGEHFFRGREAEIAAIALDFLTCTLERTQS